MSYFVGMFSHILIKALGAFMQQRGFTESLVYSQILIVLP